MHVHTHAGTQTHMSMDLHGGVGEERSGRKNKNVRLPSLRTLPTELQALHVMFVGAFGCVGSRGGVSCFSWLRWDLDILG